MAFLHGVDLIELADGARPIQTVRSSTIGIVGTAPDADPDAFPLNTPVLIAGSRSEAAKLDTVGDGAGTLPAALDGILDQAGAVVVVVRVDEGADDAATQTNVIGGVDGPTGQYQGLQALLGAESALGFSPRIIIAPGFSGAVTRDVEDAITGAPVLTEMQSVAARLRAAVVADGPNTNDADALAFAALANERTYVVDPWVKVWDTAAEAEALEPASARVAGVIARTDNELGFWWSPSNREILGIIGTGRPVDFVLGDASARANLLNEGKVATIIRQGGYRLWGNLTGSVDAKWQFLSIRRTADMINDSLLRAHLWAVDRGLTATYFDSVVEGVNAYLRQLRAQGAIINGSCWVDKELNTPATIEAGEAYFDFDFSGVYPAQKVTFRSRLTNRYLDEVLA